MDFNRIQAVTCGATDHGHGNDNPINSCCAEQTLLKFTKTFANQSAFVTTLSICEARFIHGEFK